jgi:ribose transport system substrate-binding protein
MKKLIVLFTCLALIAGFAFAGGGQQAAGGGGGAAKTLAVVIPGPDHGFTGESVAHAQAEAKKIEATGVKVSVISEGEASKQMSGIENLLNTQNVGAVVLWPTNGDELRTAADLVKSKNIPLIIYDRFIPGFKPDCEISGDNVTIGKQAGEYFNNYFKSAAAPVNYLQFIGDSSTVPQERTDGFMSTVDQGKFKQVRESFLTNWSQETSMNQMQTWLDTSSQAEIEGVQAIFTHDDEIVLGIVTALKNYKGPAKLNIKLITGVAAGKEFMDLFQNPPFPGVDFVTWTFSPSMVREAVDLGLKALNGEKLQATVKIATEAIDKSNYQAYMAGDLYKTRYSLEGFS